MLLCFLQKACKLTDSPRDHLSSRKDGIRQLALAACSTVLPSLAEKDKKSLMLAEHVVVSALARACSLAPRSSKHMQSPAQVLGADLIFSPGQGKLTSSAVKTSPRLPTGKAQGVTGQNCGRKHANS